MDAIAQLADREARRLRETLGDVPLALHRLIDLAASAYARARHAEDAWRSEGADPTSPWLKLARDAHRDYRAALALLLRHVEDVSAGDPLGLLGEAATVK